MLDKIIEVSCKQKFYDFFGTFEDRTVSLFVPHFKSVSKVNDFVNKLSALCFSDDIFQGQVKVKQVFFFYF